MNALRVVLVILGVYALLHVTTQTLRHVFVALVEPRPSVLTTLDSTKKEIVSTDNLEDLIQHYKDAKNKVDQWKASKTAEEIRQAEYDSEKPPYSVRLYREAIEHWETRQHKLYQLHFYWWCGAACLIAGFGCWYRANPWLGTAFFMVAFGEMIYWTTPEFRMWSDNDEFIRLVLWKLLYSTITLTILLTVWVRLLIPQLVINPAR